MNSIVEITRHSDFLRSNNDSFTEANIHLPLYRPNGGKNRMNTLLSLINSARTLTHNYPRISQTSATPAITAVNPARRNSESG